MSQNLYKFLVTTLPRALMAVWMVCTLVIDAIWISMVLAAICFVYFFVVQVYVEKARPWHSSGYLYGAIGCAVLAVIEHQYGILDKIL